MPPGPPPFENPSARGPPPMESAGFAQSMGAFGAMLKIQEKLSELLPNSKVPWSESREFLKNTTIDSIRSTPLYRFHMGLFKKIGLGEMQLVAYAPMHYIYAVPNCPVCNLYPTLNNQKVCAATTDALYRFFTEDLEIECSVEEIECVKDGAQTCKFKVDLQPISAYKIILDDTDKSILSGKRPQGIDDAQLQKRANVLTTYKLMENGRLSEIGNAYMQYAGSLKLEERIFDPPWKAAEELSAIAQKSGAFGAAFGDLTQKVQANQSETSNSPKSPSLIQESHEKKDENNNKASFAELIAKMKNKE